MAFTIQIWLDTITVIKFSKTEYASQVLVLSVQNIYTNRYGMKKTKLNKKTKKVLGLIWRERVESVQ